MANCVTPNQIAKDICKAVFSELYAVAFLDTSAAAFTRPTVAEVTTRVGTQEMIDAETFFMLTARSSERTDADMVTVEIAGIQDFVKQGEIRIKMRVAANYDTWEEMNGYNYFSNKECFLYEKNNVVTYINDADTTTPTAYGLPLGMVQVDRPPLFTNGTDSAEFYMYFNIDANLLSGIERGDLDFPISTLNPVAVP